MALRTKCILAPIGKNDGVRVSVMSRHTLSDGVTPDLRITPDLYHAHLPQLGPSPTLAGDYYKRGLPWREFEVRFEAQIQDRMLQKLLWRIAHDAIRQNVTLLCIEETPQYCHRRLLAYACQKHAPGLEIMLL